MKGILIIDMPNQCYQCPCFYCDDISAKCQALDREVKGNTKPNDCPLKPVHSLKSGGKDYIIYERQFRQIG